MLNVLIERRDLLRRQREAIDAELVRLDKAILRQEAFERAPKLGIKIMSKTWAKAEAWGTIAIILERHGPLTTSEIKSKVNSEMDNKSYTTLRSHLFRMELDGLINKDDSKKWCLSLASATAE